MESNQQQTLAGVIEEERWPIFAASTRLDATAGPPKQPKTAGIIQWERCFLPPSKSTRMNRLGGRPRPHISRHTSDNENDGEIRRNFISVCLVDRKPSERAHCKACGASRKLGDKFEASALWPPCCLGRLADETTTMLPASQSRDGELATRLSLSLSLSSCCS